MNDEPTGIEITIPSEAGIPPTPAYAVLPEGARRGVVVLHEIFARQPEIDRVVDRFGRAGYAAVAPDLLASGLRIACLRRAFQAIASGRGRPVDQILRTREWLCARTGIEQESVGLIGFCLGGGLALAAGRGWGAVSTNYGDIPPSDVMRGIGPVIGCYGARDRIMGKNGPKLEAALRRLGVEVETHTFDEVGHAFLTDGHHPIATFLARPFFEIKYDPAVADRAWDHIFGFLDRHLDPA